MIGPEDLPETTEQDYAPRTGTVILNGQMVDRSDVEWFAELAGFTQEDVTLLWGIAHHFQASTGDRAYSDRIGSLAERIAGVLKEKAP